MSVELTRDAIKLVALLYHSYLEKRKNGIAKGDAKEFRDSAFIHESFVPTWTFDAVEETCRELDRAGFLDCMYASDAVYHAVLADKGIVYMENRTGNSVKEVIKFIAALKS